MSTSYSFYVPRMLTEYDETRVRGCVSSVLCIGEVMRVDFVPIEGEPRFQKAFIHMGMIYGGHQSTDHIMNEVFNNDKGVRVYPSQFGSSEYWILLKNKKPVSETKLNIHQVAENATILQSIVEAQAQEIKALRERYEVDVRRLQQTIHTMLLSAPDATRFRLINYMKYGVECDTDYMVPNGPNGDFITATQDFVNKGLDGVVCAPEHM
jgi:hypothetical protein